VDPFTTLQCFPPLFHIPSGTGRRTTGTSRWPLCNLRRNQKWYLTIMNSFGARFRHFVKLFHSGTGGHLLVSILVWLNSLVICECKMESTLDLWVKAEGNRFGSGAGRTCYHLIEGSPPYGVHHGCVGSGRDMFHNTLSVAGPHLTIFLQEEAPSPHA
jgi:hypothetical protein